MRTRLMGLLMMVVILVWVTMVYGQQIRVIQGANLRATATGQIIGQAKVGKVLDVLDTQGLYARVHPWGSNNPAYEKNTVIVEGWVFLPYISSDTVNTVVYVRTEPNKQGTVIGQLEIGTKVIIEEILPWWYKTNRGWIFYKYIEVIPPTVMK